jgi:colicin D/self-protective colicin-like immunity protein
VGPHRPRQQDHDFYVLASREGTGQPSTGIRRVYNAETDTPVLVHNCDEGGIETSFSPKQLQSKFKHAADFGIDGNYNPPNGQAFREAIDQFVNSPGTITETRAYQRAPSLLTYNAESRLVVVRNLAGAFVSGWRMSPAQLLNVVERGASVVASGYERGDWIPKVLPYVILLSAFIERRITAAEFEQLYMVIFKNDPTEWRSPIFNVLDSLFGDVDDFCSDPVLRAEIGGMDDEELRVSAEAALVHLDAIEDLHS